MSHSRSAKIIFAILGLIAIAVVGFHFRSRANEAAVWRVLSQNLPVQPLTPAQIQITNDSVFARLTAEHDEIGHVRLANGDTWRFAFRSHHILGDLDSFSIFSGPSGTFRVRGDYFCCEVMFPGAVTPKDSTEFLAFLRSVHNSVEPAR